MQKTYTTGELAKMCHVSKRTVQYYDDENIVVSSKIGSGGRRIYTEEDLKKLQLVCLYRSLGCSLKEIKNIVGSSNPYQMTTDVLRHHQEKIDQQMNDLQKLKRQLSLILNEMSEKKALSIVNIANLKDLEINKAEHSRMEKITYVLLGGYVIILFLSCIIGALLSGIYMYLTIAINIICVLGLIYIHASQNAYICPLCHQKFTISFFKDLFTLNNGSKGKYIKCPHCQQRSYMRETYKETPL